MIKAECDLLYFTKPAAATWQSGTVGRAQEVIDMSMYRVALVSLEI